MIGLGLGKHISDKAGVTYDTDAQAYFNQLPTQPDPTIKGYYNTLFIALKAGSNNFSKLDRLRIYAAQYEDNGLVSLVNPTSTAATKVNSPTWTQYQGYTGAATKYIDSNYNAVTQGVNYTQNSCSLFAYSRTNVDGFLVDSGVTTLTSFTGLDSKDGGKFYADANDNGNSSGDTVVDSLGLFSAVRTASNSISSYRNATLLAANGLNTNGFPSFNHYDLGRNLNGTLATSTTRQIAITGYGSGTINVSELYTALNNFMTSIGTNV